MADLPEDIYEKTACFHTSGITLALSEKVRETAVEMIRRFQAAGTKISFDVNYRANLWSEEKARETIERILPFIDILFISEETCRRMMGMSGTLKEMMKKLSDDYSIERVCSTMRTVKSPKKHDFTSLIYDAATDGCCEENPYTDIDVIDRIGSGDAYVAGVLYGLLHFDDPMRALQYGNAASSVKNTIPGDLPSSDLAEIEGIIRNHNATGYVSELNR